MKGLCLLVCMFFLLLVIGNQGFAATDEQLGNKANQIEKKVTQPTEDKGDFCGRTTLGQCASDSDCIRDGCSGQVCRSIKEDPVFTTCEWRDCYDSAKYNIRCRCVEGRCLWTK